VGDGSLKRQALSAVLAYAAQCELLIHIELSTSQMLGNKAVCYDSNLTWQAGSVL
jgi:hypothetical protein